jgi:hypothetical protein
VQGKVERFEEIMKLKNREKNSHFYLTTILRYTIPFLKIDVNQILMQEKFIRTI